MNIRNITSIIKNTKLKQTEITDQFHFSEEEGIKQHVCTLPQEPDIISSYIYRGNCIALRRKIRQWMLISPDHMLSKKVFKSSSAISAEKARHLYHHFYMIHPFSSFRRNWEFIMILVFLLEFIVTPFIVSVVIHVWALVAIKYIVDAISWIDIILRFVTGYYDQTEQKVILRPRKVALRYLYTYFIFDVVSTFPWLIILMVCDVHFKNLHIRVIMLTKVVRIGTFLNYLGKFGDYKGYPSHKFRKFNLVLMFMLYMYWTSCFLFLLSNVKDYTWMPEDLRTVPAYALLYNCYRATLTMFLITYGDIPTENSIEILFNFMFLTIGLIFNMYMLAEVLTIRNKSAISSDKYSHLIQQLEEFMKYKELPDSLRSRITVYFDFRFQKRVYKEADLLSTLSPLLVKEILLHQCQKLVQKVDFFKDLPTSVTYSLVQQLKPEIFLPNDIIVQAGLTGQYMYFIFTGTVAVYTTTGKEICHLTDGSHFGEIALIMNVVRTAYVVAVDACELFKLSRKDFQEAVEPFPALVNRIQSIAQERLVNTTKITHQASAAPSEEEIV